MYDTRLSADHENSRDDRAIVTTLIPTFERRRLLLRAIASALSQDYAGSRVHVFDNHSADGTGDLLAALSRRCSRLRCTIHPTNIGGQANFMAALASVDTPFFSILSDDDLLLPGFYRRAIAYLERHPDCGAYCGDTVVVLADGSVRYTSNHNWTGGSYPAGDGWREMKRRGHPTWTGIVFRREVLQRAVLRSELGSPSDLDFELQVARHFGIHVSRYPSAAFTMGSATASANKPISWVMPAWTNLMREHCRGYGAIRTREILFLSDRYFADLLSLLAQRALPAADRALVVQELRAYPYWSGLGNRLLRRVLLRHGGDPVAVPGWVAWAWARKLVKLIEQPRLLLNFLKLRRVEHAFRRTSLFAAPR